MLASALRQLRAQVDETKDRCRRLRDEDAQLAERVQRIEDVARSAWAALNEEG